MLTFRLVRLKLMRPLAWGLNGADEEVLVDILIGDCCAMHLLHLVQVYSLHLCFEEAPISTWRKSHVVGSVR